MIFFPYFFCKLLVLVVSLSTDDDFNWTWYTVYDIFLISFWYDDILNSESLKVMNFLKVYFSIEFFTLLSRISLHLYNFPFHNSNSLSHSPRLLQSFSPLATVCLSIYRFVFWVRIYLIFIFYQFLFYISLKNISNLYFFLLIISRCQR